MVVLNIAAKAAGMITHAAQPPMASVYRRIRRWAKATPVPASMPSPLPYIVYAPRITKNIEVTTVTP